MFFFAPQSYFTDWRKIYMIHQSPTSELSIYVWARSRFFFYCRELHWLCFDVKIEIDSSTMPGFIILLVRSGHICLFEVFCMSLIPIMSGWPNDLNHWFLFFDLNRFFVILIFWFFKRFLFCFLYPKLFFEGSF